MTVSEAEAYLQTIDPETIDLITEYKELVDNSGVSEIGRITCDYHILAVCEGYVESSEEFDQIYDALGIVKDHE